jgi:8-oxo-dGTP diphosphatase
MIDVSCAIIIRDSNILIVRRSPEMRLAGKWEFPGGKLDEGESPEESIIREIKEELLIDIEIRLALESSFYSYPRGDIELFPFVCHIAENQEPKLTEHDAIAWVSVSELYDYDLAPADVPILKQLEAIELK